MIYFRKLVDILLIIIPFILLCCNQSLGSSPTNIEPGLYAVNGLRGGAELKKSGENNYTLNVALQYDDQDAGFKRNTGFTGSCYGRDGYIVCPVVFDDEYFNEKYELIVKQAGKNKITIDMPNGGSTALCGAGFCVADRERIYIRANNKSAENNISKQIKDMEEPKPDTYITTTVSIIAPSVSTRMEARKICSRMGWDEVSSPKEANAILVVCRSELYHLLNSHYRSYDELEQDAEMQLNISGSNIHFYIYTFDNRLGLNEYSHKHFPYKD